MLTHVNASCHGTNVHSMPQNDSGSVCGKKSAFIPFFFFGYYRYSFFFPRIIPSRVTSCYMQAKKESLLCCVLVCVYVLGVRVCVGVYILQCARIERDNAVCT